MDWPSGGCAAIGKTAGFVSPGSTTALTSGLTVAEEPPSTSSGPFRSERRCGCTANCFVPGWSRGEFGSVIATGVTVTVCATHQFDASNVSAAADSVVRPSFFGVIVTVPAGALVSRTV